ncbi:hypothetical protein RG903_13520 [Thermithiobacillus tepidarius DSM 3134]|uniref:hypothetical protein n=1 Tax=Thermithiobacillus tepidarius TaxID=929 RepID=UPI0012DCA5D2|nr:hypothetical protein [Thermithiobacillus tepidarius]
MRAIFSPRQLRQLTPGMLGLWLAIVLFAAFQPCAALANAMEMASAPAHAACPEAAGQHDADCCQTPAYVQCNLPDLASDGLHIEFGKHLAPALPVPLAALLLPQAPWSSTAPGFVPETPPRQAPAAQLSGVRLLI